MMLERRFVWIGIGLVAACCWAGSPTFSEAPESERVSQFASVEDLLAQVDFFVGRVEESLADPARYDLAQQSRVWKDGNTLAALGLVLANHDAPFAQQASMGALVTSAQALVAAEGDADAARAALNDLQAAREGKSPADGKVAWSRVASLGALMKQVPLIHAGLKRGATASRLKRMADQTTGQSAALAAIAQAARFDDEYTASAEQAEQWAEFCIQMRDAAGEVNAAIHSEDAAAVESGMKRLQASCEACHAQFRQ